MSTVAAPKHERQLRRDPGVELARTLACLSVIGCHCWYGTSIAYAYDVSRNLISCLVADGVAIFWLITGCFLFNNYSYRKTMMRTLKGIVAPLAVYSAVMLLFGADLIEGTFTWAGMFDGGKLRTALKTLLRWRNPVEGYGFVWYLYVYILMMVCSPALYGLSWWLDGSREREAGFLAVTLALILLNDITCNGTWEFSHAGINALFPASIEVMWGHILYRHRDELAGKGRWAVYLLVFLGLNLLRMAIQMGRYQAGTDDDSILYWYSSIGLICACCVLLGCCSILGGRRATAPGRFVCWTGSYTFTVYLLHIPVRNILDNHGFRDGLYAALVAMLSEGGFAEALYVVGAVAVVGGVSLVIAIVLRALWRAIRAVVGMIGGRLSHGVEQGSRGGP